MTQTSNVLAHRLEKRRDTHSDNRAECNGGMKNQDGVSFKAV